MDIIRAWKSYHFLFGCFLKKLGEYNIVATVPFVYGLLSSKEAVQYAAVLKAVQSPFDEYRSICDQPRIMTDIEKAIISAYKVVFPNSSLSCCFFISVSHFNDKFSLLVFKQHTIRPC